MKILLINRDYDSYVGWFPTGLAYVAASLRSWGHEVMIWDAGVYHWDYGCLTQYLNDTYFDIVAFGLVGGYYEYKEAKKLVKAIGESVRRRHFLLVVGGHLFSPEPDWFLEHWNIDQVVVGEAELWNPEKYPSPGIIKESPQEDLLFLPFPAYELFEINHYVLHRFHAHMHRRDRALPIISSRGCIFHCNFCYRMIEGQRLRDPKDVVEEITMLQKEYDINYISFADELFMASKTRAVEMAEALMPLGIRWDCMGRLNYADLQVLKTMKRAGCVFINYGIEQFDNCALRAMHKALTENIIVKGIEATLEAGISPGLNMIYGNVGDWRVSLQKSIDFLLRYDDGVQLRTIRPVTPYPGSDLYKQAVEVGLIKDIGDFYENLHTNSDLLTVNFTPYTDEEVYEHIWAANRRLTDNYFDKKKKEMYEQLNKLYGKKDASFRGFRPI